MRLSELFLVGKQGALTKISTLNNTSLLVHNQGVGQFMLPPLFIEKGVLMPPREPKAIAERRLKQENLKERIELCGHKKQHICKTTGISYLRLSDLFHGRGMINDDEIRLLTIYIEHAEEVQGKIQEDIKKVIYEWHEDVQETKRLLGF